MSSLHRPVRSRALAGLLAALALVAGGCGTAAAPSPPTGVDELAIPTQDPDASDFVATVDNPWLPLAPGSRWTYETASSVGGRVTTVVEATAGEERDGIAITDVTTTVSRQVAAPTTDHFAQDRDGNVWWFGRDGEWFDEPGLAMPAEPRRGDGFRMALTADLDVRAEVSRTDDSVVTPLSTYEPVVVLRVVDDGVVGIRYYAEGVGLVRSNTAGLTAYDVAD
ncbi:hypothetical protein [Nocardioides sp. YIM 152588]|uniref:hypothetical protein n=1 Tax=Nocardioides sp. YIM 152588 TaxID=3158259 RepID=UPI0032E41B6E